MIDLHLSEDVSADAVDALDEDVVGRIDTDDRRRVVDHFALVQTSTYRVSREHSFVGDVVDVAACIAVHQAASNCLGERYRAP